MIKALIRVRLRSMLAGSVQGKRGSGKRAGKGTMILFALLMLYAAVVFIGMFSFLFYTLAQAYCPLGLDWLYFTMAGIMALALSVIGTAFTTQNQIYDAKDNDLLLSMPIPPGTILLCRIIPLYLINLLFSGIVYIPAVVMYGVVAGVTPAVALQILALPLIGLPAMAIACLLGWLLHMLMRKMNKSLVSVLFTVLFLGVYFYVYSQANAILAAIAVQGEQIASAVKAWVWPVYAMGQGCLGNIPYFLAFALICAAIMAATWLLLSARFLKDTTGSTAQGKKRRLSLENTRTHAPVSAILRKELRRFIGTPVYLTNMGVGLIMVAGITVAAIIFRGSVLQILDELEFSTSAYVLIICAMMLFLSSTVCISAPSVSLEGKSLWILKTLPIQPVRILQGKLLTHMLLTVPLFFLCGGILAAVFGCTALEILLCAAVSAVLPAFIGVLGLWAGLQWPKLDYVSEVYPCKQSAAVTVAVLLPMGLTILLGVAYLFTWHLIPPAVFALLCGVVLAAISALLYHVICTWGVGKWETLS